MLDVAAAALEAAARVSVLLPVPGGATLLGANVPVTPAGNPLTESDTAAENPFRTDVDTVIGVEPPILRVAFGPDKPRLKLGASTVKLSG